MRREITSKVIWILWIALQSCSIHFALDQLDVNIIEFPYQQIVVTETQHFLDIPVIRRNDLLSPASVSCTTESLSAKSGQDFEERTAKDTNSMIDFFPGESTKPCRVFIINDAVLESNESFTVTLSHATGNGSFIPMLGTNHTVTVTIVNDEDFPMVQLEHGSYTVQESLDSDRVATVKIKVLRLGDTRNPVTVRASTRDGLAMAGTDFHPKNELLTFEPGVDSRIFEVDILNNGKSSWSRTFSVDLSVDLVPVKLGLIRTASITIISGSGNGSPIIPMAPIVVSLVHYDNVGAADGNPSPGYPLVCISPCDPKFSASLDPKFLCRGFATNSTHYMWEIASVPRATFKPLLASTLFARVDTMVLDSVFFREGLLVRCAVWPKHGDLMGIPVRSKAVTIGSDSTCRTTAFPEVPLGLQTQSFIATLKYVGSQDKNHTNRLHIHVDIPHQDGMLPLISTHALHNPNLLLTDPVYSKQHVCSTLNTGSSGFLTKQDHAQDFPEDEFPQQFNSDLRGGDTVLLYKHLNLKKCLWSFDAWYHMAELVDLCGGYVLTDSQVKTLTKSSMTVRVPLYVSYVTKASLSGWTSIEHHTEMDFTFSYNSLLWQAGVELEHSLEAQLQIQRLSLSNNGQLIVNFQTKVMFRGLFVTRHHTLPNEESRLIPPNHLVLKFTLDLLWTAETYDGSTQTWRAISDYSLKDYTGKYILQLIPCTVLPTQTVRNGQKNDLSCTAHPPQKFVIPIAFQQTNRPVPVTYSLNTEFHLLNNENIFLSDPRNLEYPLLDADYNVAFSKGQKVYGRVSWHPNQDLASAYQLLIDKVFLCAGLNNYVPTYDPSGEEYEEGPQFGCLRPNKRLKHRIIILDRNKYYEEELPNDNFLDLNPIFVKDNAAYSQLESKNGIDGFVFDVDGLYKIDAAQQWFVQVLYSIGLAENSKRFKRTTLSGWRPSENGTNMKPLSLIDAKEPEQNRKPLAMTVLIIVVISLALLSSGLVLRYYRSQRRCRSTNQNQHPKNSNFSAQPLLANAQKDTLVEKTAANQYCTVKFQKVPAMVSLSEEPTDMTEV